MCATETIATADFILFPRPFSLRFPKWGIRMACSSIPNIGSFLWALQYLLYESHTNHLVQRPRFYHPFVDLHIRPERPRSTII